MDKKSDKEESIDKDSAKENTNSADAPIWKITAASLLQG